MAEDKIENFVRVPHDHDVLLGRGGLSNHHPGNNWYRCLVRSNKTLYDQAPKHAKHLTATQYHTKKGIAEAIVDGLQARDPPGRFLQKCNKTGLWMEASYDTAVRKTSQALRETVVLKSQGNGQDRQSLHNLLIPIAPADGRRTTQQGATLTTSTSAAQNDEQFDTKQGTLQPTASWLWSKNKKQKTASSLLSGPIPSPTEPVRQQSSSLLRFYSMAPQGSEANAISYDSITPIDTTMMNGGFDQSMEPTRFAPTDADFLGSPQCTEPASLVNPIYQNMFRHDDGISRPSIEPLSFKNISHNNKKLSRDTFESSPPLPDGLSLTRLTSQVSDWLLKSFWPIGEDGNGQTEDDLTQELMQVTDSIHQHSQPSQEQKPQKQQHTNQAAARASSSQPSTTSHLSDNVAQMEQQSQSTTMGTHNVAAIQMTSQQMHTLVASETSSTNVDAATKCIANNVGLAPPPLTTLKPSITSALLALVSTPSRLLAGLSAIFSDSSGASLSEEKNGVLQEAPLVDNNIPPLIRPPPFGNAAQFGVNQTNNVEPFNSISEVINSEHDPRYGRPASGSLFDDDDD
ncbi:hypothetical protein MHU86_2368 [Fragilaria crotonensis]|nr:hypothetical protein MHU86_2368 [Fragilaria crotonensis]